MMKWPNLDETLENLKRKDSELALDDISSDAFSFFSGLILPGVSCDENGSKSKLTMWTANIPFPHYEHAARS